MTAKIIAAITAALLLGVVIANSAGAAGRPWWCNMTSQVRGVCDVVHVADEGKKKVEGARHAAGATVEAGQQSGRVVVSATELTGTVLGKTADAIEWANARAAEARIPSRTLQPGECIGTANGRYCRPKVPTPTRTAPATTVGTCVVDSKGVKWCVTR